MEGDRLGVPQSTEDHSQRSSISSAGPRNVDVLVYLIDDTVVRLTVDNLPSVTAHELHRIVLETLRLPEGALELFSLWLVSPFLELQLKPKHQPYKVCRQWQDLLFRFTSCSKDEIFEDEPSLQFRRNIFFPKRKEAQIQDEDVLRLLYEEAKYNILEGRYPCDLADCEVLGALVCRVNLGRYDPKQHTASFLKERLDSFLPSHLCRRGHRLLSALWKRGSVHSPADEQGLLRAFRELPEEEEACEDRAALRKLYHAYLQKCHELPHYGCAFFYGEIDKPAQGLLHRGGRKAVVVAISLEGVSIIDSKEKHILLGLAFQELSWDHTFPNEEEHILWLEFDGENEGTPVNKLLKVYSKQAELMSGLIEYCIELNTAAEGGALDPSTASSSSASQSPPTDRRHPKLQRQNSVLCSRIQHLSTIDYVEDEAEQTSGMDSIRLPRERNQEGETPPDYLILWPPVVQRPHHLLGCPGGREPGAGLTAFSRWHYWDQSTWGGRGAAKLLAFWPPSGIGAKPSPLQNPTHPHPDQYISSNFSPHF